MSSSLSISHGRFVPIMIFFPFQTSGIDFLGGKKKKGKKFLVVLVHARVMYKIGVILLVPTCG